MRAPLHRLFVIAVVGGASAMLAVLIVASVLQVAHAQVRPGRGGGGAGGVALQASTPGTAQPGNINVTGAVRSGSLAIVGSGGTAPPTLTSINSGLVGLNLQAGGVPGIGQDAFRMTEVGSTQAIRYMLNGDVAIRLDGTDGVQTTIGTGNTGTALRLSGQAGVIVSGNLTVTNYSVVNNTQTTVGGSGCIVQAVTITGGVVGAGCVASCDTDWTNTALTLTCLVLNSTTANLRFCNTGTNTVNAPIGIYRLRIFN